MENKNIVNNIRIMRKKGSTTKAKCWEIQVLNQNEVLYKGEYSTLKEGANDLGMSYNQIVEMSSGRKKQPKGRYDTTYKFIKKNKKKEEVEILSSEEEVEDEIKEELDNL